MPVSRHHAHTSERRVSCGPLFGNHHGVAGDVSSVCRFMKKTSPRTMTRGRPVTKAEDVNPASTPGAHVPTDEYTDLVRLAATGDTEALERLLLRVQEVTWRFSTSVCG